MNRLLLAWAGLMSGGAGVNGGSACGNGCFA